MPGILAFRRAALAIFALTTSTGGVSQPPPVPPQSARVEMISCPFDSGKALRPVECGRMKVPENYDDPRRTIEIAFMIVRAPRGASPNSPVLFLNGGPGQVSLHFAETLVASPLIREMVVDRDWVFFDQRGTGRSTPALYCAEREDNGFEVATCRDELIRRGVDLSQYNSMRSASDMEALRRALGVKQWNLWGLSYGSRLALTMARYYPGSVRAIVHDAAGLPGGQELIDDALGTEAALNRIFSKCAVDSACSSKFPQLRSRFLAALPRLRKQPIVVGEKTFDDRAVVRFFRNWFYPRGFSSYEHRLQNLLVFIDAAARGDGKLMVETQQQMRTEEFAPREGVPPVPAYGQQSIAQNLAVYCNEKKPFESPDDVLRAAAKSEIVRAMLGDINGPSDCALWPSGEADPVENSPVYYDGPQLAFTGELDASSSGLAGYRIAMLYPNARNVVFKDGTHGQVPTELPNAEDLPYWRCALQLGRQFFDDPERQLDTSCAKTRRFQLVQ